jgi:hypothetical protein
MFVSYKKQNLPSQVSDKDKTEVERQSHSKLRIISGNITRANSESKVNIE